MKKPLLILSLAFAGSCFCEESNKTIEETVMELIEKHAPECDEFNQSNYCRNIFIAFDNLMERITTCKINKEDLRDNLRAEKARCEKMSFYTESASEQDIEDDETTPGGIGRRLDSAIFAIPRWWYSCNSREEIIKAKLRYCKVNSSEKIDKIAARIAETLKKAKASYKLNKEDMSGFLDYCIQQKTGK